MSSSPTNASQADRELADELVQRWSDNLKKALLGYSVLRVLAGGPAWSKEIFAAVSEQTNWYISE